MGARKETADERLVHLPMPARWGRAVTADRVCGTTCAKVPVAQRLAHDMPVSGERSSAQSGYTDACTQGHRGVDL
jgi:hypothetical protein